MAGTLKEVICPDSPLQPSSTPSLSGEGGFLPHHPINSGMDGIAKGFRFAAPGRKPPIAVGIGIEAQGKERVRIENTDVKIRIEDDNHDMGGLGGDGMEALKVSIPIFPSAPLLLPHNPTHLPLPPPHEVLASFPMGKGQMPPPPQVPGSSERGRNRNITKEKRKRIDSSGSLRPGPGERDWSGNGRSMAAQTYNGECRLLGKSRAMDAELGEGVGRNERRGTGTSGGGALGDGRGPKKRQIRPLGPSGSRNGPSIPLSGNRDTEVIILDDDIKAELVEVNAPISGLYGRNHNDARNIGIDEPVPNSVQYLQRDKFQAHTDQPIKRHVPQLKDSDRCIGSKSDTLDGQSDSSNSYLRAGMRRINHQPYMDNKSSVSNSGVIKKKGPGNTSHAVGKSPPIILASNEEQGQSSSGEHKLLMALTTLTTEKQSLENKLHDAVTLFKTQVFRTEVSEKKNIELEIQVKGYKDTVSGLKKKMLGAQKFVDGLGKDYDMLNEKKTHLSNRLSELSRDRSELLKSLQEVRTLAEKVDGTVQGWGISGIKLKEAYREIEKLNKTLKFLYAQLSENAGLLAAERDRTQSLECQIQEDRERNKAMMAVVQGGNIDIVEKLAEIRELVRQNELCLAEKLTETQKGMEVKMEADSDATRNLVRSCFRSIEKFTDRDVDASEGLLAVERKINHTSDSIIGLFHETHKMNAEALSYTDGYISHLNSRTMDLAAELKGMYEKYETLLVTSAEKGQLVKELELKLNIALKRCDDMNNQIEKGNKIENALNESISSLKQKFAILEPRPAEDPSAADIIKALEQRNYELERKYELARNGAQDISLSLQAKDSELDSLRIELEALVMKHEEAEKRIEGFTKERGEFMAHAEEQKMKERIEVETNANMFRQRETSLLNNKIKALEAQKKKLETENREIKAVLAQETDVTMSLRNEITQLNTKYADIEKTHLELLQERAHLENMINNLMQIRATASTNYLALEKLTETTTDELSKALEKTNILRDDKRLMLQEIHVKELELERAKSEKSELLTVAEDATALQLAERKLREALKEAEYEKRAIEREKDSAVHSYKTLKGKAKTLEKTLGVLKGTDNMVADLCVEFGTPKGDIKRFGGVAEGAVKGSSGVFRVPPRETAIEELTEVPENSCTAAEALIASWDNRQSFPPQTLQTPPERIFETQIDHDTWGDSPRVSNTSFERPLPRSDGMMSIGDLTKDTLRPRRVENSIGLLPDPTISIVSQIKEMEDPQTRKNLATKFASQHRSPSIIFYSDGDEAAMIEDPSDDATGVVPHNVYSGQTSSTTSSPRSRTIAGNQAPGNSKSTLPEKNSFSPKRISNRSKALLRDSDTRVEPIDDSKGAQYRPRKERSKKIKDDQEWIEGDGGFPRNKRGKEEAPNLKKSLRDYKERKKGGRKLV